MPRKMLVMVCLACAALIALPAVALACGGLFSAANTVYQAAERMIFAVHEDGTITAVVGIHYTGAAEEFSWLLPVPSAPEVGVADQAELQALQFATEPRFDPPAHYCREVVQHRPIIGGGQDGVTVVDAGVAGPYEYLIIAPEDPAATSIWLRDNGYSISMGVETLINEYALAGMYFVAMRLRTGADAGDIQPVVLRFQADQPMIPLRMAAGASAETLPIYAWIFADEPYAPANVAHPARDFSGFRGRNAILGIEDFRPALSAQYQQLLNGLQAQHNGQFFVTEYAAPTDALADDLAGARAELQLEATPLLDALVGEFAYVTRLRGQLAPGQMLIDPVFTPLQGAGGGQDTARDVDLAAFSNPLHYWGCSTRALRNPVYETTLEEQTRVGWASFRYPQGWQQAELVGDTPRVVIAPPAANAGDLQTAVQTALAGNVEQPLLIIAQREGDADAQRILAEAFGAAFQPPPEGVLFLADSVPLLFQDGFVDVDIMPRVYYGLITTRADFDANRELYSAMINAPRTYQYYASAEMPNTLFLNAPSLNVHPVQIAYPDGWIEFVSPADEFYLLPEGANDVTQGIRLEITTIDQLTEQGIMTTGGGIFAWLHAHYALDAQALDTLMQVNAELCYHDSAAVPFSREDGRGYIRWHGDTFFAVFAGTSSAIDDDGLKQIAQTAVQAHVGC